MKSRKIEHYAKNASNIEKFGDPNRAHGEIYTYIDVVNGTSNSWIAVRRFSDGKVHTVTTYSDTDDPKMSAINDIKAWISDSEKYGWVNGETDYYNT